MKITDLLRGKLQPEAVVVEAVAPVVEKEEELIIPYFLRTHPLVERLTIPSDNGIPRDVLLWVRGNPSPYSVLTLVRHAQTSLLQTELLDFARATGSTLVDFELLVTQTALAKGL